MKIKEIEFHEVEIKFLVRKGGPGAETKKEMTKNVIDMFGCDAVGLMHMDDECISMDGKRVKLPWEGKES